MQGTVKWFNTDKGYGYIVADSGVEHYFNVKDIKGTDLPSNGDLVTFDSKPGRKDPHANNVFINKKSSQGDSRVVCPQCGKKIVPRLIIRDGRPRRSVCPYCAGEIKDFGQCFIATAVYGDRDCFEVKELRRFRDDHLLTNEAGRIFVKTYYRLSPPIAEWLKGKQKIAAVVRVGLELLLKIIG